MVATPMRLEDALRFNGYTIDPLEIPAATITLPTGVLSVPPMLGSRLTWRREGSPRDIDSLYLTRLPVFNDAYRPVILSNILDRYRTRRIGYDVLDEFGLAVRRWGNLTLGPTSVLNQWYASGVTALPLTTVDLVRDATRSETTTGTLAGTDGSTVNDTSTSGDTSNTTETLGTAVKARNAESEFPQVQLGGDTDYADEATDTTSQTDVTGAGTLEASGTRTGQTDIAGTTSRDTTGTLAGTDHATELGRNGRTIMELVAEQRALFVSADEMLLDAMESLFLGVYDLPEVGQGSGYHPGYGPSYGFGPAGW